MRNMFYGSKEQVLRTLVAIGNARCVYAGGPWEQRVCDCKYGYGPGLPEDRSSEVSGCPELRSLYEVVDTMTDEEWDKITGRAEEGYGRVIEDSCPDSNYSVAPEAVRLASGRAAEVVNNDAMLLEDYAEPETFNYDARRLNWPRLAERMLSSTYNALFYGALIVAARALGIF